MSVASPHAQSNPLHPVAAVVQNVNPGLRAISHHAAKHHLTRRPAGSAGHPSDAREPWPRTGAGRHHSTAHSAEAADRACGRRETAGCAARAGSGFLRRHSSELSSMKPGSPATSGSARSGDRAQELQHFSQSVKIGGIDFEQGMRAIGERFGGGQWRRTGRQVIPELMVSLAPEAPAIGIHPRGSRRGGDLNLAVDAGRRQLDPAPQSLLTEWRHRETGFFPVPGLPGRRVEVLDPRASQCGCGPPDRQSRTTPVARLAGQIARGISQSSHGQAETRSI